MAGEEAGAAIEDTDGALVFRDLLERLNLDEAPDLLREARPMSHGCEPLQDGGEALFRIIEMHVAELKGLRMHEYRFEPIRGRLEFR